MRLALAALQDDTAGFVHDYRQFVDELVFGPPVAFADARAAFVALASRCSALRTKRSKAILARQTAQTLPARQGRVSGVQAIAPISVILPGNPASRPRADALSAPALVGATAFGGVAPEAG